MEKKTLNLTCKEYLIIQALFHATEKDGARLALSYIWYDASKDLFVATDGHMMRQEQIEWIDSKKPEESFLIHPNDMMLTKSQLRNKFGSNFEICGIELGYEPKRYYSDKNEDEIAYPKIWNVIPPLDTKVPLEEIGINPELFDPFMKSFYVKPKILIAQLTGETKAILLFSKKENEPKKFVGIWMPLRILK